MTADLARLEEIFTAAVAKTDRSERAAYLDEACGGDADLRQRLEDLLAADADSATFLPLPKEETTAIFTPVSERPGSVIGRYKLLEQIGEGGFGVVFMAEQEQPVRRRVALKIIKAGMDTRQVVARFEAERQALALMDHPNIARVFDGGATETGRPYFVMELVRGVPITEYCDRHRLSITQRLELFQQVCQAVQHAHQKGLIHRDIKPTNVLVGTQDDRPVAKVIDFGVAKAIQARLTERTLFTEFHQLIGTPVYMSPEQAEGGFDVDTRSDVYSLGVLLYELLVGTPPFSSKELRSKAFGEMQRIIREVEPPTPSTRLNTLSAVLASVAAHRAIEPRKLVTTIRGELDWIVMRALEKDRTRRYPTANALSLDIGWYLNDEPVQACPPSAGYRFSKFARRNKAMLFAAGVLTLAGLVALGAITFVIWERTARQARVTGQVEVILDEVARLERAEKWTEALLAAQRAEPVLSSGDVLPEIQQRAQQAVADLKLIQRLDEIRVKSGTPWSDGDVRRTLSSHADQEYAVVFREAGIDFDALPAQEVAKHIMAHPAISAAVLPALDDWIAVRSIGDDKDGTRRLAEVLRTADPDPWRQRVRDALARKDWLAIENLAKSPDLDRQPAPTLSFLSAAVNRQGISEVEAPGEGKVERESRSLFLSLDIMRRAQWRYPNDFWINHRLGTSLIWHGGEDAKEGMGFVRAAVAIRPESSHAISNLGNGYSFLRRHDQAIKCFRKAIELKPDYWICWTNLGMSLARNGQFQEAIDAFDEAIRISPDKATEAYTELSMVLVDHPGTKHHDPVRANLVAEKALQLEPTVSNHWTALGLARYRAGKWKKARAALEKSLELESHGTGGALRWDEAINWFVLTMVHHQSKEQERARECFDRGIQEMENGLVAQTDETLVARLRDETAELLGINKDAGNVEQSNTSHLEKESN